MNWTSEQRKILESNGNILVSAAAGSGKTAVLTERIVRLVEQGTPIERMLVLTFTNAAAAEMKSRIEKKLYERCESTADPKKRAYLYDQMRSASRAAISTIDSFCQYLLKRHFYEAELSPNFRTGDNTELSELLSESLNEALEKLYSEYEGTHELISVFLGEDNLIKAAESVLNKIRTQADGKLFLDTAIEKYTIDADTLKQSSEMNEALFFVYDKLYLAYKLTLMSKSYISSDSQECIVDERAEFFRTLLDYHSYDEIYDALQTALPNFRGVRGLTDEFKELKKSIETYYSDAQSTLPEAHSAAEYIKMAKEPMELFREYVMLTYNLFAVKKQELGIIDFSDMELFAFRILKNPSIADIYKERFLYVFVDEYQDINPLQDAIIEKVLSADNAFFVGDAKQSIYRFRNSSSKFFIDKMRAYEKADNSQTLTLSANFRSSNAVINFANTVFERLMTPYTSGISYDAENKLVKMGSAGQGKVKIHYLEKTPLSESTSDASDSDETETETEQLLSENAQAQMTAEEIKSMLGKTFFDAQNDVERNFTYSDFAVIMRSTKTKGEAFLRELLLAGIPVYMESTGGLFESLEVQVFINLLKLIDNKRQDVPLLSIMRSTIGGFSMDEIVKMRVETNENAPDGKQLDILDMLRFSAEACENEKARIFLDKLCEWQELSLYMPLTEFVQTLLLNTGYYGFIEALPDGNHRADNLNAFLSLVTDYESSSGNGLYDFLNYLETARENSDRGTSHETASNAVTILTMHKSKGLEYNVVIIPNMERNVTGTALTDTKLFIYDNPALIGSNFTFHGLDIKNFYYNLLKQKEKRALFADELRLLYVAFTRARDTLILLSTVKNVPKKLDKLSTVDTDICEAYMLNTSVSYIDIVNMALKFSPYRDMLNELVTVGKSDLPDIFMDRTPIDKYALSTQTKENNDFLDELNSIKSENTDEIETEMNARYPYESATKLISKGSVTGFTHTETEVRYNHVSEKLYGQVSATQRGTITHSIFEKMPLREQTEADVKDFINSWERNGTISRDELRSLNIRGISDFYQRPLYKRMLKSDRVLREQNFTCLIEASRLIDETDSNEPILVQGIIDCCFIENGKWIILDYKTDSVDKNNPSSVKEQALSHKKQLELYAYVLRKITHIEVSEAYICFVNAYDVKVIG